MLFRTKEFVEQSLRISSKSFCFKPQSLWRQPLSKGRHPHFCSLSNVHRTFSFINRSRPRGGSSQNFVLLLQEGDPKGGISRLAKMRKPQCTVVHEDFRIKRNAENFKACEDEKTAVYCRT